MENVNLNVFHKIVRVNESKTLISHISCECKYGFGDRKFNLNQKCNNNKC